MMMNWKQSLKTWKLNISYGYDNLYSISSIVLQTNDLVVACLVGGKTCNFWFIKMLFKVILD